MRGINLALNIDPNWLDKCKTELAGNEDRVISIADEIYSELLLEIRKSQKEVEGQVPHKYSPDLDAWLLWNPKDFDTTGGRLLIAASIVKALQVRSLDPKRVDWEEELSWLRKDIFNVVEVLIDGPLTIDIVAGEKTGASYLHTEDYEVISVKISQKAPNNYPVCLKPIIQYISYKADEYDLRGSIPHEFTHAYLDRRSSLDHKKKLGEKLLESIASIDNNSKYHFAVDEAAAQSVSYIITGNDIVTRAYESGSSFGNSANRELTHSLMQTFCKAAENQQDIGKAIARIRITALKTIELVDEGAHPINAANDIVEHNFDSGFTTAELKAMVATATRVRQIQYEILDYLVYIGIYDIEDAYNVKKDLVGYSEDFLANKKFLPLSQKSGSSNGFHLEELKQCVNNLSKLELNKNELEVMKQLQYEFEQLIKDIEEEKMILSRYESQEIKSEAQLDQQVTQIKTRFKNPEVTSPKQTEVYKEENVIERYYLIAEDYLEMIESVKRLNLEIKQILSKIHEDENKAYQIIQRHKLTEEHECIKKLIMNTESHYKRIVKGEELIETVEEQIIDLESKIRELEQKEF